ncbi:MAG: hypothetical protein CL566_06265 [Alphaproteobacteria bacterium]|nr:hypothetical protein [Alphaproteobacteria bacterium]
MNGTDNCTSQTRRVLSGLDRLLADVETVGRLADLQIGFLTNHACNTADEVPASAALARRLEHVGKGEVRLFTPEHGIGLSAMAGEGVDHGVDPLTGLPVFSLYTGNGTVDGQVFDGLNALVIDLRDVGVRCYTYAATAAQAACAALERHIEVIVCDRANPLGPAAEGPRPDPDKRSFLAFFDVPFIHGQSLGELVARAVSSVITEAPFSVYPADMSLQQPLGWIPPSPALSHPDAVAAYGGLVLLEATNISEGRGSSLSFRCITAPGLDADALAAAINGWTIGFRAGSGDIISTHGDHAGRPLPGVVIWPRRDPRREPLALGVHLLAWLIEHHDDFAWRANGGSSVALDTLFGRSDLREMLDGGASADEILRSWR